MRAGQLGVYINNAASDILRNRDGGLVGFYVQGAPGTVGFYDVATTASVTASATILASASVQAGWNWLPVAFTHGLYISNGSALPITAVLAN